MVDPVPQKISGTVFEYKTTSGGTYAPLKKTFSRQIPMPNFALDDCTGVEDNEVDMEPTINDWGDLVLSILYDPVNAAHAALNTAAASNVRANKQLWIKMTEPSGRISEFTGPAYQFGDKSSGPKDHRRNDFKMRINTAPVITGP